MLEFNDTADPFWRDVAKASVDDIREALITGYKDGKPFHAHNYLLLRPGAERCNILDFGCGIGRNFRVLNQYAHRLAGFDIPEMIDACKRECAQADVELYSDWSRVGELSFDLTVATLVLQHLIPGESLTFYLGEIARISPYLYVASRAWCDGEGHANVLREILDSGHFDYVVGVTDLDDALALEYPSETHLEFVVKSRYCEPRDNSLASFFSQSDRSYRNWLRLYDTLPKELEQYTSEISTWSDPPLISVIMPTHNSDLAFLKAAINSVTEQVYVHWELCIADDASEDDELIDLLREFARDDTRIKLVLRDTRGHISINSNAALELARGDYIALLDHDDLLSRDALYWVARTIREHPEAALIYSDEDKIDIHGRRSGPYFKSDWNPDLFLSHNLVTHLAVFRRDLVMRLGGFTPGLEGSQDYDLALRVVDQVATAQILHIPRVLYHWRQAPSSTALGIENKSYALDAAIRAIGDYLRRRGIDAEVCQSPDVAGHTRVRYKLPEDPPLVSIIIPTRDYLDYLKRCVDSIITGTTYPNYEILVIDNDSKEPRTLDYLKLLQEKGVTVLEFPGEFNFSRLMNFGVERARGEILVLLNNDTEVINQDWLGELASHVLRPEVGVVGARLWFPDDTLQHAGVIMGMGDAAGHHSIGLHRENVGYAGRACLLQNYTAVTGACMACKKQTFQAVGGMNEKDLAVAYNDIDFCLRVGEMGLRVVWTPYAELYHHESVSRGYDDSREKQSRFRREVDYIRRRWGSMVNWDPAYNPNLCVETSEMRLAFPPRL